MTQSFSYFTESTEFLILSNCVTMSKMIKFSQYSYFYVTVPIYFILYIENLIYFILFLNCYRQLSPAFRRVQVLMITTFKGFTLTSFYTDIHIPQTNFWIPKRHNKKKWNIFLTGSSIAWKPACMAKDYASDTAEDWGNRHNNIIAW